MANHAFHILTKIGIEQIADIIADILFVLIDLVLLHLFKGQKLTADKGIVLRGMNFIFFVYENINQGNIHTAVDFTFVLRDVGA